MPTKLTEEQVREYAKPYGWCSEIADLAADWLALSEENGRLREALEFYADQKNYTCGCEQPGCIARALVPYSDQGKIANTALNHGANP